MNAPTTEPQPLKVGQCSLDRKTGQAVRICKVTEDFIEWRDEKNNGHGRIMRRYFGNFYQHLEEKR